MKVIFKHAICWLLWFSVTGISTILKIESIPLWSLFFNIGSSILLFYAMFLLSGRYYKKLSLVEGLNRSKTGKWSYFLFKWEIGAMLSVIAAYIGGSWLMDNYFFTIGHVEYRYDDFLFYIDSKFARGTFYIATGIAYGLVKMAIARKNEIIAAQKALNIITMQENALMKNTYSKRVKEMRNMVKSALADKDEY
jgi:hypothetical protein